MLIQALLKRAVKNPSPAIEGFIDHLCPSILENFSDLPALGGSGRPPKQIANCIPDEIELMDAKAYAVFRDKMDDQSMATHLLNGIFAAFRLLAKLPEDKSLSELEQKIWILGYIMHDYTKVFGVKVEPANIPAIRALIGCLGENLNFEAYLPGWNRYLDDVAFLAQNTQTREGSNLNRRAFENCKINARQMEVMCKLASITDILVHIKSPSDVVLPDETGRNTDDTLRRKIDILFGGAELAPKLVYHRLTEVRGLISNLISNAIMAEMQEKGCEPFLFFPNGVVYLAEPKVSTEIDIEHIANIAWKKIVDIAGNSTTFITPWTTGLIVSSGLYELAGVEGVLEAGKRRVMQMQSNNSPARLYGYFTDKSENDLKKQFNQNMDLVEKEQETLVASYGIPADKRVNRLGEYLKMVYSEVKSRFKKSPDISDLLIDTLGLSGILTGEQAKKNKGGTYFGWYYAASRFIEKNPQIDMDSEELEMYLEKIGQVVLNYLTQNGLTSKGGNLLQTSFETYIQRVIEINNHFAGVNSGAFEIEIQKYVNAKNERKTLCSLCSTPYDTNFQEMTELPFINQQYSNKNLLDGKAIIRGICPICRVEMMVRQAQQAQVKEGSNPVQIFVYPTYFFTPETSEIVKSFLTYAKDLDLSAHIEDSLIRYLRSNEHTLAKLLNYPQLLSDELAPSRRTILAQPFSEDEFAGLTFVSMTPLSREATDTDTWILPAFYAFALPLLLNVKVVATSSYVPLFASGAEFRETVILDAPHNFLLSFLKKERFRVDETAETLMRLMRLYDLHVDVFEGKRNDFHWAQINAIVHDVLTDPLYVFSYYDRRKRDDKQIKGKGGSKARNVVPRAELDRYFEIYLSLGGVENMCSIGKLVDAYAEFYQHDKREYDPSSYVLVRPLNDLIETALRETTNDRDCLKLTLCGVLSDMIDRVWDGGIKGAESPIKFAQSGLGMKERKKISLEKQEAFVEIFLAELFEGECKGQRAVLQERANRIRSAAKFYYTKHYFHNK